MLTYDDAMTSREFWHMTECNKDGTPLRARRNGKTKTWKRRPGAFNVPVKRGLAQFFNITDSHADQWCTPEKWPVEHVLFEGVTTTVTIVTITREQQLARARKAFKDNPTPALGARIKLLEQGRW